MKRNIAFLLTICLLSVANAVGQTLCEQLFVATDKPCYVAGERLYVRVDAFQSDNTPSPSKVAYIEIADQYQLQAQAMVTLTNGQGWAEIALPARLHSGYYQLTAYTRAMRNWGESLFYHTNIGVVNGEQISRRDHLHIFPVSDYSPKVRPDGSLLETNRYAAGSEMVISLPETDGTGCAFTLERTDLLMNAPQAVLSPKATAQAGSDAFIPEFEGHIVNASLDSVKHVETISNARLAIVGKNASLYDGQVAADGSVSFFTTHLTGSIPVVLDAFDVAGNLVPLRLESPYSGKLPTSMPRLDLYCNEDDLLARVNHARKMAAVSQWMKTDSLTHSVSFMSEEPEFFYDLNEYTQMNSIREILLEFVNGVKRGKEGGRNVLFTFNTDTHRYSNWPALVLLDGMPVNDIDEILDYDSHLVRFVQIYSGRFTFGKQCVQGVISFITHKGRLSNYKLSSSNKLQSYGFPQDRPAFVDYLSDNQGTLMWLPAVQGKSLTIKAPSEAGKYQVTLQGRDASGAPFRKYIGFEVR